MNKFNTYLLLIPLLLIVGCAPPGCMDKACFIDAANNCESLEIEVVETSGTFQYASNDCVFTKTVNSLNEDEAQDMKSLLEGKSLSCSYQQGGFNENWVNSLVVDIEDCDGDLKDTIAQLILFS